MTTNVFIDCICVNSSHAYKMYINSQLMDDWWQGFNASFTSYLLSSSSSSPTLRNCRVELFHDDSFILFFLPVTGFYFKLICIAHSLSAFCTFQVIHIHNKFHFKQWETSVSHRTTFSRFLIQNYYDHFRSLTGFFFAVAVAIFTFTKFASHNIFTFTTFFGGADNCWAFNSTRVA